MQLRDHPQSTGPAITTPDQRLRVFVSSTLQELAPEREAVKQSIRNLRLTPVMFEAGARVHPPVDLYRSYLDQSDVFVGIYWESYGWIEPDGQISGIEDEYRRSEGKPRLLYVKEPAPGREPRLQALLDSILDEGASTFRLFSTTDELSELLGDDLAVLITERFHAKAIEPPYESGTLTFVFADLEDSTGLIREMGSDFHTLLHSYHELVHRAVGEHHGHVVRIEGDGFFVVFADAVGAVAAARDIQMAFAAADWPGGVRPRCRIGIHTGTATWTPEGYVGLEVHVAARIGAAAQGGQILVSDVTSTLLAGHPGPWTLVDLGRYELRGIGRNERLMRLDIPGLEAVSDAPRAKPHTRSTVPSMVRPIVGRTADVEGATEMLMRASVRLVTITGPGGTGKTRLAVELARLLEGRFPDGVTFIDLASVRDREGFLPAVGRALGVRESTERPIIDGLKGVVGEDAVLLVLDNMEQIIPAGADVGRILESLPNAKILITSRSPLRISWENEYPLPPLPVPAERAPATAIDEADAVRLFVERAQAVRPGFEMNEVTRPVVAEITRRLDGLPLAIELAAARLRIFSVELLLSRLEQSLSVLDRGPADAPERHRTLRSAIRWSHDLLTDDERIVFRRLSVFSGGWDLEAALEVLRSESLSESQVLDAIDELVAKSLVSFSIDEAGTARYRMLETLREFSLEQLQASGEEDAYRLRHLEWCHSVSQRVMNLLQSPEFIPFLDLLERERFNLREALMWSERTGIGTDLSLDICGFLPLFFDTRGFVAEGLRWSRSFVAMTTAEGVTEPRGRALAAMGWLEMMGGNPEESERALAEAVQMFRDLGDDHWLGRVLSMQAMTTYNRHDLDASDRQFQEAIVLCRAQGLDWLSDAWCEYGLAHIALDRGDFPRALEHLNHALEYSRTHDLAWGIGHIQLSLGVLAFMTGDLELAAERLTESLLVRQKLRDWRGLCDGIGMMGLLASVRDDHPLSATLLGAGDVARKASGHEPVPWIQPLLEQAVASATAHLGAEEYRRRFEEGRALSVDEAIDLIVRSFAAAHADQVPA